MGNQSEKPLDAESTNSPFWDNDEPPSKFSNSFKQRTSSSTPSSPASARLSGSSALNSSQPSALPSKPFYPLTPQKVFLSPTAPYPFLSTSPSSGAVGLGHFPPRLPSNNVNYSGASSSNTAPSPTPNIPVTTAAVSSSSAVASGFPEPLASSSNRLSDSSSKKLSDLNPPSVDSKESETSHPKPSVPCSQGVANVTPQKVTKSTQKTKPPLPSHSVDGLSLSSDEHMVLRMCEDTLQDCQHFLEQNNFDFRAFSHITIESDVMFDWEPKKAKTGRGREREDLEVADNMMELFEEEEGDGSVFYWISYENRLLFCKHKQTFYHGVKLPIHPDKGWMNQQINFLVTTFGDDDRENKELSTEGGDGTPVLMNNYFSYFFDADSLQAFKQVDNAMKKSPHFESNGERRGLSYLLDKHLKVQIIESEDKCQLLVSCLECKFVVDKNLLEILSFEKRGQQWLNKEAHKKIIPLKEKETVYFCTSLWVKDL